MDIFQKSITPDKPRVLAEEQIYVYVPVATSTNAGIASYDRDQFDVIGSEVSLKWPAESFAQGPIETPSVVKVLDNEFEYTGNLVDLISGNSKISSDKLEVQLKRILRDAYERPELIMLDPDYFVRTIVEKDGKQYYKHQTTAVHYNMSQKLSEDEQAQARLNIGAGSLAVVNESNKNAKIALDRSADAEETAEQSDLTSKEAKKLAQDALDQIKYNLGTRVTVNGEWVQTFDADSKADIEYVDNRVAALIGTAPETLDTLEELATALSENADVVDALNKSINTKLDKRTHVTTYDEVYYKAKDGKQGAYILSDTPLDERHIVQSDHWGYVHVKEPINDYNPATRRYVDKAFDNVKDINVNEFEKEFTDGYSNTELSDVTTWTKVTSPSGFTARQRSCCYGNGYYVIAGTSGQIAYSKDTINWVNGTSFSSAVITGLAYGNGWFLAVDSNGYIYRTDDPSKTWSPVYQNPIIIESIRYVNNKYYAVGQQGFIGYSFDGYKWTQATVDTTNTFIDIGYGNGKYIAVGHAGTVYTSVNGITWYNKSIEGYTTDIRAVYYANGNFVIGTSGGRIDYSEDGETWTRANNPSALSVNWIRNFTYHNNRLYAVMYVSTGQGEIWVSKDKGKTWSVEFTLTGTSRLWCICSGNDKFIASGDNGYIFTLDMGLEWQDHPTDGNNQWYRFKISQNDGSIVYSDAYYNAMSSEDYVKLNAAQQTISGQNDTPIYIKSGTSSSVYIGLKDKYNNTLGYFGANSSKEPIFYNNKANVLALKEDVNILLNDKADKTELDKTNAQVTKNTSAINDATISLLGKASTDSVDMITAKIPAQASATNQLADKEFVNSSIATNTAIFKGTFEDINDLPTVNVDNNDYAFIRTTDVSGNILYKRYKYDGTTWNFEYELNNSSFTAAQWSTINSGLTAELLSNLATKDYVAENGGKIDTISINGVTQIIDANKNVDLEIPEPDLSDYLPLTAGSSKPLTDDLYITSGKYIRLGNHAFIRGDDTDGRLTISAGKDRIFTIRPNPDNSTGQMHIYGTVFRPGSKDGVQLGTDSAPWSAIYGTTIYQNGKQVANKEDLPSVAGLATELYVQNAVSDKATTTYVDNQISIVRGEIPDAYTKTETNGLLNNKLSSLTIGTVTSGATASATITGSAPNQTLNLVLPKGETGSTGATGAPMEVIEIDEIALESSLNQEQFTKLSNGRALLYDKTTGQLFYVNRKLNDTTIFMTSIHMTDNNTIRSSAIEISNRNPYVYITQYNNYLVTDDTLTSVQSTLQASIDTKADSSEIPTDYVDLTSVQNISGLKNFTHLLTYKGTEVALKDLSNVSILATVATSGSYNDLSNKPTIPSILSAYPVGAIYMSIDATSPASLFGGTWTQIGAGYALWTATSGAGGTIGAGLPNITGADVYGIDNATPSGAFVSVSAGHYGTGTKNGSRRFRFSASNSNSIYGSSSTVQPPAYKVYAWRRTA